MSARESGHPLAAMIRSAAKGRFPPVDGGWRRVPPWREGLEAVVAFTGHAVLAIRPDVPDELLVAHGVGGFGGAHDPRLVSAVAGPGSWIDSLDAVLVARGAGGRPVLVDRPDLADHPRVAFAAAVRDELWVLGRADPACRDVVIVSRGLAGLTELSLEIEPSRRGSGAAAGLVTDALRSVPADDLVVANVSPGNAASLRALLAAGFTPVGSMQLFRRA